MIKKFIHVIASVRGGGAEHAVSEICRNDINSHKYFLNNTFPLIVYFRLMWLLRNPTNILVAHLLRSIMLCMFLPGNVIFYHHSHISKTSPFLAGIVFALLKNRVNIFPSEEMRFIYATKYKLTKTFVVEPPFKSFEFKKTKIRKRVSVSIVSRLEPIKNVDKLLRIILKLNLDVDVHVFGDGTQLNYLKVEYPQVIFHGWVDDKSLIYENTDLILMYSDHETFNLVLTEATYAKKVVITNTPELFAKSFFREYDNILVCKSILSFSKKLRATVDLFAYLKFNFRPPKNTLENFDSKLRKIAQEQFSLS